MRALTPTLLLLALALTGCGDKDDGGDGDGGASDGGAGDGGTEGTDSDGDGHASVESGGDDCDDGNAAIFPDAEERCDGIDNDCDDQVDEDFDQDGDGFVDAEACDWGDDCDDSDGATYPGAEEIPYDGIDQDCDDADITDVDGDGVDAEEAGGADCDDTDADIAPGEPEVPYDGVDQDCDGADLLDADGDGYDGEKAGGPDCNDYNASISPGATEVPYDGVDQDCTGGDLVDVDGDGFDAEEVGGTDCVDDLATINPDAREVPYDEIDQDCDGEDQDDLDGDGYAWEGVTGGTDCDDRDDTIHPGATEVEGDGVDSDCDGSDTGTPFEPLDEQDLDDIGPSIWGATASQDYLGIGLTVCDLDDDGRDDLLVTAPLSDSYHGQIGIFYGASAEAWSTGMSMSDADAVIESAGYFMAFEVKCADVDGDGILDLVTDRGEIQYTSTYVSEFQLLVWYGDGSGFSAGTTDREADATLTFNLGVPSGYSSIYTRTFTMGDVTGDGAADFIVNMEEGTNPDGTAQNGDNSVWVVPGGTYSGDYDMEDEVIARLGYDGYALVQAMAVTDDLDGDGVGELVLGQAGYDPEADKAYEGLLAFISDPSTEDLTISEAAWASILGETDDALAFGAMVADLDGDGALDALVNSYYDATAAEYGGGLYLFEDLEGLLSRGTDLARADYATGHVYGEDTYTFMGVNAWPVGDLNRDGVVDVMVGQYAYTSGGMYYVVDGEAFYGEGSVEDALLASFRGTYSVDYGGDGAGAVGAVGDFDGDGSEDLVMSSYLYITTAGSTAYYSGRVYMFMGSEAGW